MKEDIFNIQHSLLEINQSNKGKSITKFFNLK